MFKRKRVPPVAGVESRSAVEPKLTALHGAALGMALCVAHPASAPSAAPLRDAQGLAVTCRLSGMPNREANAAEAQLCARIIAAARRDAPYAVGGAVPADVIAPRLAIEALISGDPTARRLTLTASLARPGQAAAPRLTATPPSVAYDDGAAVDSAIEIALSAVLPWRAKPGAQAPRPPRVH